MNKLLLLLSLSIILLTSVYAWVNKYHYHTYTGNGYKFVIRENIFTMDRCTLRLGFMDASLQEIIEENKVQYSEKAIFPGFCKDTPEKL